MYAVIARLLREPPAPSPGQPLFAGALAGLELLEPVDLRRYKRGVVAGRQLGFAYFFPGLLAAARPGRGAILFCEDAGSTCVFRWTSREGRERLEVLLAPAPMDTAVLKRCLERANEFNGDRSARVIRVDDKDAAAVASVRGLEVRPRKSQYLFDPRTYRDLGGGRMRTIRRNVQRIASLPGIEVQPFGPRHLGSCLELLRRWGERHAALHGTSGGVGASKRVLTLTGALGAPDLVGEVVLLDGRLVAYALGGEIRPGVGAFLDARCEAEPAGLGFFHRYSFLAKQEGYEIINDGSDVGREGLRQLKNSLRPVGFHVEHRATQVTDRSRAPAVPASGSTRRTTT